eukprot:CAMPEP_0201648158 /NCGR_PEP_ID=MMETSP0493-20130528/37134_1 /ASSEMBLY_ACC=CAM_ASM_000838 /TAXON_ID=420259 /ORGANISM="Thalassiosira gravida, Strain GMp14c1" /LENGTH=92 /DNA_ID=CAMNT_0048123741 /DNA_START=292 /DNA_END=566 /DNA_ORIENTATION=+
MIVMVSAFLALSSTSPSLVASAFAPPSRTNSAVRSPRLGDSSPYDQHEHNAASSYKAVINRVTVPSSLSMSSTNGDNNNNNSKYPIQPQVYP